jgi:thymidylate synthase
MNKLDKDYQNLLSDIITNGKVKKDRTGTGTLSVFGRQIRHKMSEGFPLLTTKKMAFKTIVTELLWFLRGDTNIKYLIDNDCHIWNGDAYKNYSSKVQAWEPHSDLNHFIERVKTNDEFAKKWGELGPIYGKQWRNWNGDNFIYGDLKNGIDQIANLINELKTNPDSRRLMVSAWNVDEMDKMTLPPCHYGFQVYTRLTTREEKIVNPGKYRAISLMWNQRSVDTFLGLPFNIASYGLLLEILAKEVNMVPDELIGNLGDVHLYLNHIEQAKEQIGRKYTPEERETMLKDAMSWRLYNKAVNELMPFGGGMSEYYDAHKIPYHTREPYPLPILKHMKTDEFYKSLGEDLSLITHLDNTDFVVENYQSHPTIKAPLSN